jgi:GH24 family phage-related lysozyme (muramidase)
MTLAEVSFAFLCILEGVKLRSYQDSVGIWTIGYGHTGPEVGPNQTITLEEALAHFEVDTQHLFKIVEHLPIQKAAAYVCFGYNCGIGALQRVLMGQSNLLDFVKGGRPPVEIPALVARRRFENTLIQLSGKL